VLLLIIEMVFHARAVETSSVILMLINEDIIAKAEETKEIITTMAMAMGTGITTVMVTGITITNNNNHNSHL